ncbi:hypothetical protein CRUP_015450 [Coryphaenoides rupestris]|nr:hypothetical protein CRUP_015450 [Coryphaenoides rupestris]
MSPLRLNAHVRFPKLPAAAEGGRVRHRCWGAVTGDPSLWTIADVLAQLLQSPPGACCPPRPVPYTPAPRCSTGSDQGHP